MLPNCAWAVQLEGSGGEYEGVLEKKACKSKICTNLAATQVRSARKRLRF